MLSRNDSAASLAMSGAKTSEQDEQMNKFKQIMASTAKIYKNNVEKLNYNDTIIVGTIPFDTVRQPVLRYCR